MEISNEMWLERLTFDLFFFNIFCMEFLYRLVPNFIIPSNVMACMPIVMVLLCFSKKPQCFRFIKKELSIYLLVVMFLLINVLLGNTFLEKTIISPSFLVLSTLCIFLYTRSDIASVIKHINYVSVLIGILVIINALALIGDKITNFYMSIGYTLSLQSIILFETARIKKKRIYNCLAVVFSIFALVFGNRGALLIVLVYVSIDFFFIEKREISSVKYALKLAVAFVVVIVLIVFFDEVLSLFYRILNIIGVESRTFDKLVSGSFTTSTARNVIYDKGLEIIKVNPIVPKGIGYMTTLSISGVYTSGGVSTNAHSILLELLIEYGVVIGTIIFICILIGVIKSVRYVVRYPDNAVVSLTFCLLLQSIILLSFSSSLYESNELWMGLVLLSLIKHQKLGSMPSVLHV